MEFTDVFSFLKKYYQLFIVFTLVGLAVGFGYSRLKPAEYESTSKVVIELNTPDKKSDYGYLATDQLSLTYTYLVTTQPILDAAGKKIGSTINPLNLTVTPITNTTILEITAKNRDPKKAVAIANALADAMVENSKQLQENSYLSQETGLNLQIAQVEGQISDLETSYTSHANEIKETLITEVQQQITTYNKEISTLQQDITSIGVPVTSEQVTILADKNSELSSIQTQLISYETILTNLQFLGKPEVSGNNPSDQTLAHIQTAIDQYQSVYLNLLKSLADLKLAKEQVSSSVELIAPAQLPKKPVGASFLLNPEITALIGLVLSIFFALFLQNSQTQVRTPGQLSERLGLETLGRLHGSSRQKKLSREVSAHSVVIPTDQEVTNLRASLEIEKATHPYKRLLLTGFSKNKQGSSLASALALNYAFGGQKVLLVEADFSHSENSEFVDGNMPDGLRDLLYGNPQSTPSNMLITPEKNLKVLPAGNSYGELESFINLDKLRMALAACQDGNDIVIIDGPDISDVNTRILSATVEGILLELHPGKTLVKEVQHEIQNLNVQEKSKLLGVVFTGENNEENEMQPINLLRMVKFGRSKK